MEPELTATFVMVRPKRWRKKRFAYDPKQMLSFKHDEDSAMAWAYMAASEMNSFIITDDVPYNDVIGRKFIMHQDNDPGTLQHS